MAITKQEMDRVIRFVKDEPRTVQDIARLIDRSWVTTDTYLEKIRKDTGLISIKTFRKGTQAALKIVFYSSKESLAGDELKEELYKQIRISNTKEDIDFFEIFQFVQDSQKKASISEGESTNSSTYNELAPLFRKAQNAIYCFSGNMSFINASHKGKKLIDEIEMLLRHKIKLKVLCRVNIASLGNISKLNNLMKKYPDQIEIRHCYHGLRGCIIDDKLAHFKKEESPIVYRSDELSKETTILYDVYDKEWIVWLERVFWNLFRTSIDYRARQKQFEKFF